MVWIVVVALAIWLAVVASRAGELRANVAVLQKKLARLEEELAELRGVERRRREPEPKRAAAPAAPAPKVEAPEPKPKPNTKPPLEPELEFAEPAEMAASLAADQALDYLLSRGRTGAPDAESRRAKTAPSREQMATWLSENGLAWAGGGVLALGGIFLVAYAAQRGFFNPAMRIAGPAALGGALIGVSEWLRRQANREVRGNRLAAAAAAGAGAATLYAAAWASYALYHFIGLPVAAGLMGLTSAGLLGLALLHGEALAILAIGGGLLAPAITGAAGAWPAAASGVYLGAVLAAGFAASGLRRLGRTGLTALAGALIWAGAAAIGGGVIRAALLAAAPMVFSVAALEWRRRRGETFGEGARKDSFTVLPLVATVTAAVILGTLWMAVSSTLEAGAVGLALTAVLAAAAFAVRRGLVHPAALLVVDAAVLAAAGVAAMDPVESVATPWAAIAAPAAAACGLWSALSGRREVERLCGAGGALTVLLVSLALEDALIPAMAWVPPALAMAALFGGAWAVARGSTGRAKDLALAAWVWCAASGLLAALQAASPPAVLPGLLGAAAAVFAVAHVRLGWRGWLAPAVAAALASLTTLVNPDLLGPLFAHRLPFWAMALTAAAAAGLTFAAARALRPRAEDAATADTLSTASLMIGLAGAFILLRLWGSGPAGERGPDPFLEASIRTALTMAGGLLAAAQTAETASPIGRWRGQVMLALGAAHALFLQGLVLNPIAASWTPAVAGPPLVDSLAVGFLAPALLMAAATRARVARTRLWLIAYAALAAAFAGLWGLEEIRRLFQGPSLNGGRDAIGRAEVAAYAVAALLGAASLMWTADRAGRKAWTISPIADLVRGAGRVSAGVALAFALLVFGWAASPWWGPIGRPLDGLEAGLLFVFYAAAAGIALWLVKAAEGDGVPPLARAVRIGAVAIVFALVTLLVRWGFRGFDMRPNLREASVETWTFSAVWGLFGFGLLAFAAARRESDLRWAGLAVLLATTAKVFLFDMARLEGVVRAGSFLAVGALLLAAAVVARRLSGGVLGFGGPREEG